MAKFYVCLAVFAALAFTASGVAQRLPESFCTIGEPLTEPGGCNNFEVCCSIADGTGIRLDLFDAPPGRNGACCFSPERNERCPRIADGENACMSRL